MSDIVKYPVTVEDLVLRDLRKAELNLEKAKKKKNVTQSELDRCEELVKLRREVYVRILFKQ